MSGRTPYLHSLVVKAHASPSNLNGILSQNQACETKSTYKFFGLVLAAGAKEKMIFFHLS